LPERVETSRAIEHIKLTLEKLARVQEQYIDYDYLKTDEFANIFLHIKRKVIWVRAKENAQRCAEIAVVNCLVTRPSESWQHRLIEILADLHESEMKLLRNLETYYSAGSVVNVTTPYGLEKWEFQLCFDSLVSHGLVYDASFATVGRTLTSENVAPRSKIEISPLGRRLMRFIDDMNKQFNQVVKI
jgi:hypothetical protein